MFLFAAAASVLFAFTMSLMDQECFDKVTNKTLEYCETMPSENETWVLALFCEEGYKPSRLDRFVKLVICKKIAFPEDTAWWMVRDDARELLEEMEKEEKEEEEEEEEDGVEKLVECVEGIEGIGL